MAQRVTDYSSRALAFALAATFADTLIGMMQLISQQYSGVDPLFLMASGMLTIAPMAIVENW